MRLPKPTEKVSTRMPSILATRKWPNSCRTTAAPRMKTKARIQVIKGQSLNRFTAGGRKRLEALPPRPVAPKVYAPPAGQSNNTRLRKGLFILECKAVGCQPRRHRGHGGCTE